MGKGKGHFRSDIKKQFGTGPIAINNTSQQKNTVADQTKKNVFHTFQETPDFFLDFESKTFGSIKVKKLPYEGYSSREIIDFFTALDFTGLVTAYVKNPFKPYIDDSTILQVNLSSKTYTLHAHLMRYCLPHSVRKDFAGKRDHYECFKELFLFYDRRMLLKKFPHK